MTKKWFGLLGALMAFSLVGCTASQQESPSGTDPTHSGDSSQTEESSENANKQAASGTLPIDFQNQSSKKLDLNQQTSDFNLQNIYTAGVFEKYFYYYLVPEESDEPEQWYYCYDLQKDE